MIGDKEKTEYCLERGFSPKIYEKSEDWLSPQNIFSILCIIGNNDLVKMFLRYGANINKQDADGMTPLLYAVDAGHVKTVMILTKNGVDVNLANNKGETPLIQAAFRGCLKIVKPLLIGGADPLARNKEGCDAVLAVYKGYEYRERQAFGGEFDYSGPDEVVLAYIRGFIAGQSRIKD